MSGYLATRTMRPDVAAPSTAWAQQHTARLAHAVPEGAVLSVSLGAGSARRFHCGPDSVKPGLTVTSEHG